MRGLFFLSAKIIILIHSWATSQTRIARIRRIVRTIRGRRKLK